MKYFLLVLLFSAISCNSKTELATDYRWIRSYSESTIEGATFAVGDKGDRKTDVIVLNKMRTVNKVIGNTLDSLSILTKKDVLDRTSNLIGELDFETVTLKNYFNLNEQSSNEDFKLQLALLETELLNYYVKRIGLMDITFDRLEFQFIPTNIGQTRVIGELLLTATSDNLEKGAKMYLNEKEIRITKGVGQVDISTNELVDGKAIAKITFNDSEFEIEGEVEIIKDTNNR